MENNGPHCRNEHCETTVGYKKKLQMGDLYQETYAKNTYPLTDYRYMGTALSASNLYFTQ